MADVKSMSDAELVDHGFKIKQKFDALELQLDEAKAEARERAKKQKLDHFFGSNHFLSVSPGSSTSCEPQELYDAYVDMQNEQGFFSAVKVLVGVAKKDLGETIFDTISKTETFPYRTVSFKENTPKKYLKK
jgi:hypothetical protein